MTFDLLGTEGVQNIRETIIENKMTFDVSSDEWQVYLKNKIMNNIERYFYLIVFAMYVREVGPQDFPKVGQGNMRKKHTSQLY